jgi:hypothetical protein
MAIEARASPALTVHQPTLHVQFCGVIPIAISFRAAPVKPVLMTGEHRPPVVQERPAAVALGPIIIERGWAARVSRSASANQRHRSVPCSSGSGSVPHLSSWPKKCTTGTLRESRERCSSRIRWLARAGIVLYVVSAVAIVWVSEHYRDLLRALRRRKASPSAIWLL